MRISLVRKFIIYIFIALANGCCACDGICDDSQFRFYYVVVPQTGCCEYVSHAYLRERTGDAFVSCSVCDCSGDDCIATPRRIDRERTSCDDAPIETLELACASPPNATPTGKSEHERSGIWLGESGTGVLIYGLANDTLAWSPLNLHFLPRDRLVLTHRCSDFVIDESGGVVPKSDIFVAGSVTHDGGTLELKWITTTSGIRDVFNRTPPLLEDGGTPPWARDVRLSGGLSDNLLWFDLVGIEADGGVTSAEHVELNVTRSLRCP